MGIEAHGSDLNPVAVLITKALIEIPPKFKDKPPINPEARKTKDINQWREAQGLAEDVRYYGKWMRDEAEKRIGHLYPKVVLPHPQPLSYEERGAKPDKDREVRAKLKHKLEVSPELQKKMTEIARKLRREQTASEAILWEALRNRKLEGRKFRRQHPIGRFVVDFYCDAEGLIVEVDGSIHKLPEQQELDRQRQTLLESLGLRFVRLKAKQVEKDLPSALDTIRSALSSSPENCSLSSQERARVRSQEATVIAWLWARTVKCPNPACGCQMPLVRSFQLATKKGKEAWVEPIIDNSQNPPTIKFEVKTGEGKPIEGTTSRKGAVCLACATPSNLDYIRSEGHAGRMNIKLMAIVAEGNNKRIYLSSNEVLEQTATLSEPKWKPETELSTHPQYMATPRYEMIRHSDLFTNRQLLVLDLLNNLVTEVKKQITKDAKATENLYADAIVTYLGIAASKIADNNSTLCTWMSGVKYEVIRSTFSRQALSMTWDFAEANPFAGSSGDFYEQVVRISKVLEICLSNKNNNQGCVTQKNAIDLLSDKTIIISTDPPYYDAVPYADLSDFFYVWLRRSLSSIYPELFATLLVPKEQELVADQFRHGGRQKAQKFFEEGLKKVFTQVRQSANYGYPFILYYAFKQTETDTEGKNGNLTIASTGWETMLEGLIKSGFTVTGTLPMRTERTARTRNIGSNALASSIVLVCRPRPEDAPSATRRQFLKQLQKEFPADLATLQQGNIAPVDLAQASIGLGMSVFSRYSKVLEADGNPMRVRTALQIINSYIDEFLNEQEGEFDPDTRWALTWFEQYQFEEGQYGDAETLSKAKNTSIKGLEEAKILVAKNGKVRLLQRDEMFTSPQPSPTRRGSNSNDWEATQHLIQTLDKHGETGAAKLLARLGDKGEICRDLAYRLYVICDRQGWTQEAISYNSLVTSWSEISRLAAMEQQPETVVQGELVV